MPEHLRALVVILIIAALTFTLAKKAIGPIVTYTRFNQWRSAWFVLTLIAFLSFNFWVYVVVGGLYLLFFLRDTNKVSAYFLLILAVPPLSSSISGMGVVNYLFEINHFRLLSLLVLLPAFMRLYRNSNTLTLGKIWPDRFLLAYIILSIALQLRDTTITDTLRYAFYTFTDIFLPYYVVSRALQKQEDFKHAISALVVATLIVAAIGVFEFVRHWLLYTPLSSVWGINSGMGSYLGRAENLRALASLGQPIVLGYAMVVALGCYFSLHQSIKNTTVRRVVLALLVLGNIVPLSRGPWVGALILFIVFILTGKSAIKRLAIFVISSILALAVLSVTPGGDKAINLLPFIGHTETANIEYRDKLIENSMRVIKRHPWFGSVNYLETPEMQEMIQGQGIIDIVNSYVRISLELGLVGLTLFIGVFATVLLGINRSRKKIADKASELSLMGRSLTATIMAILVMIVTVSSINAIPIIYWSFAGLGVAYMQIVKKQVQTQSTLR